MNGAFFLNGRNRIYINASKCFLEQLHYTQVTTFKLVH